MKEVNKNEFKGQTVDEAIASGLKELNLTKEQVNVEIKSYGGIFTKSCVILTPKSVEAKIEAEPTVAEKPIAKESVTENSIAKESVTAPKAAEPAAVADNKFCETVAELTEAELAEVQKAKELSYNFVKELMVKMNISSEVTVETVASDINIAINGADAGQVIGYRGDTLDAIQYLSLLIANQKDKSFIRVTVDAGNYRKKRTETLTRLANSLAHKAAQSGTKMELEPMNPFERRVIHTALANDKFVKTVSEGEGKFRHVVIVPNSTTGTTRATNQNSNRYDRYDDSPSDRRGGYNRGGDNRGSDNRFNKDRYEKRPYQPKPVAENRPDPQPIEVEPTSFSSSAPVENSDFGTSIDFKKKGASKTRSFGYSSKKF